mmetsp:Transcript_29444/g.83028  ORF Transcript_29444/g.83028 Transcript_29444/m.83028 type:complete len:229 (+) Transcript_29444:421-1107(+)
MYSWCFGRPLRLKHEMTWTDLSGRSAASKTIFSRCTYRIISCGLDPIFRLWLALMKGSSSGAHRCCLPLSSVSSRTEKPLFVRSFMCHAPKWPSSVHEGFEGYSTKWRSGLSAWKATKEVKNMTDHHWRAVRLRSCGSERRRPRGDGFPSFSLSSPEPRSPPRCPEPFPCEGGRPYTCRRRMNATSWAGWCGSRKRIKDAIIIMGKIPMLNMSLLLMLKVNDAGKASR